MTKKNSDGTPTMDAIKQDGAIPFSSQIVDNSTYGGESKSMSQTVDALNSTLSERKRLVAVGLSVETGADEVSVAIGGLATQQFCPITAIVHMVDVGEGAAATGDLDISIGTATGGTQVLTATECTGLIGINTKKVLALGTTVKPTILGTATLYVKVTTADTSAGAGHLANVYIIGELFDTAVVV